MVNLLTRNFISKKNIELLGEFVKDSLKYFNMTIELILYGSSEIKTDLSIPDCIDRYNYKKNKAIFSKRLLNIS